MTILQNAYKGYLTKKYEKEINEFIDLALSVIDNAELKLKQALYDANVTINSPSYSERVTKELLNLIEVKRAVKNNPLEIEGRVFNREYTSQLVDEYQKLNNLIVQGESTQFDKNKYKWDEALKDDKDINEILHKYWQATNNDLAKFTSIIGCNTESTGKQIADALTKIISKIETAENNLTYINKAEFAKKLAENISNGMKNHLNKASK